MAEKKSGFLHKFGKIVGIQVQVAGQMFVVCGLGVKSLFNLATRATSKGISTVSETSTAKELGRKMKSATNNPAVFNEFEVSETITGGFSEFTSRLMKNSMIITIAGKRGSGKSTLGFKILENIHAQTKRPCFTLGVKQEFLPSWITSVESLESASNNGVILVDEGALSFSSRDSMNKKNKDLGKLLAVARHKDLTLILITQNTGMIDKNVLNLTDTVIIKEGSLLQEKMERKAMKDLYVTANAKISGIPVKERVKHAYVIDTSFEGLISSELPSFWNSKISKNKA